MRRFVFLCVVVVLGACSAGFAQAKKPNVVVIFCDDMGWGDPGCFGGGATRGAPTPNIDKMNGYSTYMSGKWHLGDVPDSFPTAHGFDEMKHMLCYYAGVYGYRDPTLHPWFPNWDEKFVAMWNRIVNDGEYDGVAGQPAKRIKEHFGYADLATIDDEQAASAQEYIKSHAKGD